MIWPFRRRRKEAFGYLPDPYDPRDFKGIKRIPGALQKASNLQPHIKRIFDQYPTQTCVAQAIVLAKAARTHYLTGEWVELSVLWPYWFGRTWKQRFTDGGSFPREVLKAFRKVGSPLARYWPFNPKKVNKRPPPELRAKAIDQDFEYHRCTHLEDVASALLQGIPVVFGMPVDEAFTKASGPDQINSIGKKHIGRHMMVVCGNDPERRAFLVANSYGDRYRMGGYVWISWDIFMTYVVDSRDNLDMWGIV